MGSGTTQAVAMKLGRRFIGADINLGAVETTTKRLFNLQLRIFKKTRLKEKLDSQDVGHRRPFPNHSTQALKSTTSTTTTCSATPLRRRHLLIEALEIQPLSTGGIYDGEKDGRMVKIMPIDRIATRADLNESDYGFDYRAFENHHE